jgi:hypothetical protein
MDRIKKIFSKDARIKPAAKSRPQTKVDPADFAKAVVQEYGETLVLLGKE